jgi:hypothetical protein
MLAAYSLAKFPEKVGIDLVFISAKLFDDTVGKEV